MKNKGKSMKVSKESFNLQKYYDTGAFAGRFRMVPDVNSVHKNRKMSTREPGQSMYKSVAEDVKETIATLKEESPFTRIRNDKAICFNTVSMMVIWSCSNFCYFLITFSLKSLGGNVFISNYIADIAEILANLLSLVIITAFGFKITMILGYFVAASGMVILIFLPPPVGEHTNLLVLVYAVILYSKFGVAACYNLSYIGNGILFDPSILGTTIGLCTAASRFVNAGAQPIAELHPV
jgi:hypothetical protein